MRTEKQRKPQFNNEIDKYLKHQFLQTTFTSTEIEAFNWFKKMIGIQDESEK